MMSTTNMVRSAAAPFFIGSVLATTLVWGSCSEAEGPASPLGHSSAPPAWPLAQGDTITVEEWLDIGRHFESVGDWWPMETPTIDAMRDDPELRGNQHGVADFTWTLVEIDPDERMDPTTLSYPGAVGAIYACVPWGVLAGETHARARSDDAWTVECPLGVPYREGARYRAALIYNGHAQYTPGPGQ